jgi:RES domain-containing protein
VLDRDQIERIAAIGESPFEGEAFRHLGPRIDPRSGEGARIQGGRWNPPNSFPVLYLSPREDAVIAEFYRRAEREGRPPEDLLPRKLCRYNVRLEAVLDLTEGSALRQTGLTATDISSYDMSRCQTVGHAAYYVGLEGLLAPSATGVGQALALFFDRMRAGSALEVLAEELWETLPGLPKQGPT